MSTLPSQQIPKAIGPYRLAVAFEKLLFVSGQVGMNPTTGELVDGTVENQVKQAMQNLKAILEEHGSSLPQVLKTTIFLTRMEDFAGVNEIYGGFFRGNFPARSTVAVAKLPKGALVEIEAIAERS